MNNAEVLPLPSWSLIDQAPAHLHERGAVKHRLEYFSGVEVEKGNVYYVDHQATSSDFPFDCLVETAPTASELIVDFSERLGSF